MHLIGGKRVHPGVVWLPKVWHRSCYWCVCVPCNLGFPLISVSSLQTAHTHNTHMQSVLLGGLKYELALPDHISKCEREKRALPAKLHSKKET